MGGGGYVVSIADVGDEIDRETWGERATWKACSSRPSSAALFLMYFPSF